jgi:hypothetical protein
MNNGKYWSSEEEKLLLHEFTTDAKTEEIAVSHGRTNGAITSRARHLAAGFYRDGISMDEIMKRCRLTRQGLILTLRNRGLIDGMEVLKIKNACIRNKMTTPTERLAKVNEDLKHVRNTGGTPQNKWDYGKLREINENNLNDTLKRLEAHKAQISEFEAKCRLRGIDETEIQKGVYQSFSHQHIHLLEAVISAKKTLAMMDIGTVEELTRQKIAILEELTRQKLSILEEMM